MSETTTLEQGMARMRLALEAVWAQAERLSAAQVEAGWSGASPMPLVGATEHGAAQVANGLGMPQGARVELDGEAVGRLVTRTVNNEIGRLARRRRYTG